MQNPAFTHHVFFYLKNPGNTTDRDALMAGLKKMAAISLIREYQIGLPAPSERSVVDNSWSVSWLNVFDSAEDEAAYQVHPLHDEFVEKCKHLWEKVVVFNAFG